jgi:hypothetical protein
MNAFMISGGIISPPGGTASFAASYFARHRCASSLSVLLASAGMILTSSSCPMQAVLSKKTSEEQYRKIVV